MLDNKTLTDEQFEYLILEKKYNEVIDLLKKIEQSNRSIEMMAKISNQESPVPATDFKPLQDIILEYIKQLTETFKKKDEKKQWVFTIERDENNLIKTVLANPK